MSESQFEVERVVQLDVEQARKLCEAFARVCSADAATAKIINAIFDSIHAREKEAWSMAARLVGYESIADAHGDNKMLEACHITRTITVKRRVTPS